jgi:hypothetical protein
VIIHRALLVLAELPHRVIPWHVQQCKQVAAGGALVL